MWISGLIHSLFTPVPNHRAFVTMHILQDGKVLSYHKNRSHESVVDRATRKYCGPDSVLGSV